MKLGTNVYILSKNLAGYIVNVNSEFKTFKVRTINNTYNCERKDLIKVKNIK